VARLAEEVRLFRADRVEHPDLLGRILAHALVVGAVAREPELAQTAREATYEESLLDRRETDAGLGG
jgi:hypothetical protein